MFPPVVGPLAEKQMSLSFSCRKPQQARQNLAEDSSACLRTAAVGGMLLHPDQPACACVAERPAGLCRGLMIASCGSGVLLPEPRRAMYCMFVTGHSLIHDLCSPVLFWRKAYFFTTFINVFITHFKTLL